MFRARLVVSTFAASLLAVVLVACSSPATGSLKVTVNGLPGGVNAAVTVTGPGGYSRTVTATTTLQSLTPGTYAVDVAPTSNGNAIVPNVYDGSATTSSAAVTSNTTVPTTVTYAERPGSGHLWIPLYGGTALAEGLSNSSLVSSGTSAPDVVLTGPTHSGEGIAFDGSGTMWVTDYAGYIYGYRAADLASSGTPTPAVTIDATAFSAVPYNLAFDGSGDLWVSLYGVRKVTPAVVIDGTAGGSLAGPGGLAFDASGALWVGNYDNSTIVEFTAAQLAASGTPSPVVTLSSVSASISSPNDVAFDSNGNLWVSNDGAPSVVEFTPSQLTATGSPVPAATIGSASLGTDPDGLAFDASGALWVADANGAAGSAGDVRRFTNPGSLTGAVTPTPDVILTGIDSVDYPAVAFDPPPANLPIRTP